MAGTNRVAVAFPLTALGASVALATRRAPRWQVDLAGLVRYAALVAAFVTAATASGWVNTAREGATFAAVSAVVAVLTTLGLYALVGSFRLAAIGVPLAVAVLAAFTAYAVGVVDGGTLCWVVLAEAAFAVGFAVLVARDHRGVRARSPGPPCCPTHRSTQRPPDRRTTSGG